jgi:hypothetical protein
MWRRARDPDRENLLWCEFCRPVERSSHSSVAAVDPAGRQSSQRSALPQELGFENDVIGF